MEATEQKVDSMDGAARCQYKPQFAAAQSFILSRMSPPASSSPSPSQHPADSKASTTPPVIDQKPSAGIKRKRDAVDYTQNTISFPPSSSRVKTCSRCHRQTISATSSSSSSIEPVFCADCLVSDVATQRATNLASAMPHGVPCVSADLIGFPAGAASDAALTNYFHKRRPDLLNILSFCDQLRPQLLVDVLVSVARRHPDLPMFDSPDWNSEPPPPPPASSLPRQRRENHAKPRHGHVVPESKARRGHRPSKSLKAPSAAPVQVDEVVVEKKEEEEEEERDSLPPTWPRAGNGLYARLAAEEEDRSFLLDDNDEEAFSHFGVDAGGKQIALAACG